MDKLFEKILSFLILTAFMGLSFVIFNINEYEYKIKARDFKKGIIVETYKIPQWLKENSECEEFSILKQHKYTITECTNKGETVYFKEDTGLKSKDIEYLYHYVEKTDLIHIYVSMDTFNESSKEELAEIITNDFANFLGVQFEQTEEKPKEKSSFTMIKKPKLKEDQPSFTIIKKEDKKKETFSLIKQTK